MDYVATGLPERLAGADDPLRLSFQLESHLSFEHVAEGWPRVAVRGCAGIARWEFDDNGHYMGAVRDVRWRCFLQHGECCFPRIGARHFLVCPGLSRA